MVLRFPSIRSNRASLVPFNVFQICLYIIIILEFCTAIVAICTGANLLFQVTSSSKGFRFLGNTLIFIGVTLLILFFITCLLAREINKVVIKAVCCSVPLVLGLLALGIFVLSVSSQGGGKSIPGRPYKEYEVESYSEWMQNKVNDNWDDYYKNAIVKNKEKVCNKVSHPLLGAHLTLKHGCCQPPEECNFNYTNAEVLLMQENGNYSNNTNEDDCNRWDNDPNTLCFDCQSCKASFLQDVTSYWFTTGIGLVVAASIPLLMGLIITLMSVFVIMNGERSQLYELLFPQE